MAVFSSFKMIFCKNCVQSLHRVTLSPTVLHSSRHISCGKNILLKGVKSDKNEKDTTGLATDDVNVKPSAKVKRYAVNKYFGFLDKYIHRFDKGFSTKYPKIYKVYRLFKDGVVELYKDSKDYYRVTTALLRRQASLRDFNYKELCNYRQIPWDLLKVSPVLVLSIPPGGNYVAFPIAYYFPRHLLCRHFWTNEQKVEFQLHYLRSRLNHFPKIEQFLQKESHIIRDVGMKKVFQDMLHKIENHEPPGIDEIIATLPLFDAKLFGVDRLYRRHLVYMFVYLWSALRQVAPPAAPLVKRWHLVPSWSFPGTKSKMLPHASLLLATDGALARDGVLQDLSVQELQEACFYRGLNASGLTREQMTSCLADWLQVSKHITDSSVSLLLHSHFLLFSTHTNNSTLINQGSGDS